eukprot:CAMPEP_0117019394 /NCGR_PEP_ID=MMETSP0472-20121206/14897_1 /TAXON_ID=693140 ORGANISM="Tiarina fusus, Strain LIS" /NCGR_SAMPLE_ID=MMETSP0472 /ASSEMBLY_ACC=CAM_ASM_000603 /LENGTH=674 /DNA_ID=CAMNT_0004724365 /DNA_START=530 /DNA_END=2554 /DNA_ORIENTATION=-
MDIIIKTIREAYYELTAGSPCDIDLQVPSSCLLELECDITEPQSSQRFKKLYYALCSYYTIVPSSDAIHYVESLFLEQNIEVNLLECPGMETESSSMSFDIRPFVRCLGMNMYFRSIVIDDIQHASIIPEFCTMLKHNTTITRIQINNLTKNTSKLDQLGTSIQNNAQNAIVDIMISNTNLSKAVKTLKVALSTLTHGIRILQLSHCSLNPKNLCSLIRDGLMKNYPMTLTLKELNLSGNRFDDSSSELLGKLFARIGPHSSLQTICLRNCNLNLLKLLRNIHRFTKLQEFDLSHNPFSDGDVQLLCSSLDRMSSLKVLQLAGCSLKQSHLETISNSLSSNSHLSEIKYNLAENTISSNCIQAIFGPLQRSWVLHTLDLSNCKLSDSVCLALCTAIQETRECKIERLVLDDAKLDSILLSQKTAQLVGDALGTMLQQQPSIKSISLSSGYSVNILFPLFQRLQNNTSLQELNISNNKLGDSGASALASLIQNNNSLVSILCDGNNFTLPGFYAIGLTVKQSKTIQRFDIPWNDLTQNISSSGKGKFKLPGNLLTSIYMTLERNKGESVYSPYCDDAISKNPVAMLAIPSFFVPQSLVDQLDPWEMESLEAVSSTLLVVDQNSILSAEQEKQKASELSDEIFSDEDPPPYDEQPDKLEFVEKIYNDDDDENSCDS